MAASIKRPVVVGARVRPTIAYAQTWGYPIDDCAGRVQDVDLATRGSQIAFVAWDNGTRGWVPVPTLVVL